MLTNIELMQACVKQDAALARLTGERDEVVRLLRELWACECYGWSEELGEEIDAYLAKVNK
jgi:hypothetical protein